MSKKNLYRVVAGVHSENGKVYKKGDIVDSKSDLSQMNHPPTSIKFEKVEDPSISDTFESNESSVAVLEEEVIEIPDEANSSGYAREELEQLKIKELESIAEEEGIDISNVTKSTRTRKKDIITAILNG